VQGRGENKVAGKQCCVFLQRTDVTAEVGIGSYQHRREKFNLTHENKRDYSKRTKFIPEATRFTNILIIVITIM